MWTFKTTHVQQLCFVLPWQAWNTCCDVLSCMGSQSFVPLPKSCFPSPWQIYKQEGLQACESHPWTQRTASMWHACGTWQANVLLSSAPDRWFGREVAHAVRMAEQREARLGMQEGGGKETAHVEGNTHHQASHQKNTEEYQMSSFSTILLHASKPQAHSAPNMCGLFEMSTNQWQRNMGPPQE